MTETMKALADMLSHNVYEFCMNKYILAVPYSIISKESVDQMVVEGRARLTKVDKELFLKLSNEKGSSALYSLEDGYIIRDILAVEDGLEHHLNKLVKRVDAEVLSDYLIRVDGIPCYAEKVYIPRLIRREFSMYEETEFGNANSLELPVKKVYLYRSQVPVYVPERLEKIIREASKKRSQELSLVIRDDWSVLLSQILSQDMLLVIRGNQGSISYEVAVDRSTNPAGTLYYVVVRHKNTRIINAIGRTSYDNVRNGLRRRYNLELPSEAEVLSEIKRRTGFDLTEAVVHRLEHKATGSRKKNETSAIHKEMIRFIRESKN